MKDYNLGVLAPGKSKQINAYGNYIRNIGKGSVLVEAYNDKMKSVKAFKTVIGAGGSRSPKSDYTQWIVTNDALVAIDVSVLIGEGDATESDVQISADVMTTSVNLSMNSNQYVSTAISSGSSPALQLWNPVDSGVILNIKKFHGSSSSSTGEIAVKRVDYAFVDTLGVNQGRITNKHHTAGIGKAELFDNVTGATVAGEYFARERFKDNYGAGYYDYASLLLDSDSDGWLIGEGQGLVMQLLLLSSSISWTVDFGEISNV